MVDSDFFAQCITPTHLHTHDILCIYVIVFMQCSNLVFTWLQADVRV